MAALACLFFRFPVVVAPIHYAGYASLDPARGLWVVAGRLLLTHALLEETLFRGLNQARATEWWGVGRGIAFSTGLFVLWHPILTYLAIADTTLATGPVPVWLWFLLGSLPLAIAGVILGLARRMTGSLLGPIAAHWSVNSVILVFLALSGMPQEREDWPAGERPCAEQSALQPIWSDGWARSLRMIQTRELSERGAATCHQLGDQDDQGDDQ